MENKDTIDDGELLPSAEEGSDNATTLIAEQFCGDHRGLLTPAAEIQLSDRSFREGWRPSARLRALCMRRLEEIIDGPNRPETIAKAIQVAVSADNADIKRDSLHLQDRADELQEAARSMARALRSKGVRRRLSKLSDSKFAEDSKMPIAAPTRPS